MRSREQSRAEARSTARARVPDVAFDEASAPTARRLLAGATDPAVTECLCETHRHETVLAKCAEIRKPLLLRRRFGVDRFVLPASALVDSSLHALAWALLHMCSPARVHTVLLRVGHHLAPIETPKEARRVSVALARHGTCLSRALALAARTPTADVVIGVEPRKNAPLFAHAWVEMGGTPIDPADVAGDAIARLCGPRSRTRPP